jgi:putative FmdB family regulatory protein
MYEFKCHDCEIIIEEEHSMKDAPSETECPSCHETVGRFYGNMNFILKGENWPGKIVKRANGQASRGKKLGGATVEEVMEDRKKKGLPTGAKEKQMSDKEFERRKELNQKWLEQNKD